MKQTAVFAAREAGKVLMNYYGKKLHVASKKKSYDLVTEADIASEEKIVSILKEKFPQHRILTEESGLHDSDSDHCWIIDPLDGTNNFSHSFPLFSVSIALYVKGKAKIGVVYVPYLDQLFVAEKGKGSKFNGKKIHVSTAGKLNESLIVTGFYYDRGVIMKRTLKHINDFFGHDIHGIRRTGTAALDLCYVAAGFFDGYFELKIKPWDYAAGALIVTEAGGKVSDSSGKKLDLNIDGIVASNRKLHRAMISTIN